MTTFVKITNQEIFKRLNHFEELNSKEHNKMFDIMRGYKNQVNRLHWVMAGCIGLMITIFIKLII